MDDVTRKRLRFAVGFGLYFLALWLLWDTVLVYPLKVFVVLLHEVSHGLVALGTGGRIDAILVTPDQGGLCRCPGGSPFLVLSAGYLGSMLWGAAILQAARARGELPRHAATAIGVGVLLVTLLYVRNLFGLVFGALFGGGLIYLGRRTSRSATGILLTAIGLTSCLYALLDIKSDVLERPAAPSDARMLAELTGVPTLVWGAIWIAGALLVAFLLLRRGLGGRARSDVYRVTLK